MTENTLKPYVIGLDLGGTNSVFGIVDARGEIKATTAIKTGGYDKVDDYVKASVEALQPIIETVGGIEKIKAMGIGAPNGNFYTGAIEFAPNLAWAHDGVVPLADMFSKALGIPVALTNDANAAALGEMTYGAARGMKNFIDITLGTGVGSGIVINGQMLYGSAPQILLTTDARAAHAYAGFTADCPATEPELPWELSVYDETLRLFTSGTTGRQKSVCLTSINEVLSAHDVMIHFPFSFTDRSMNTTPWFHRGGLHSGGITPTLYAGGTVIIQRKFQPEKTLDMVQQYGLTFLIGVPNVLELLAEAQQKQPRDLSSLRGIVTMGSPLERADCIRYQKILTKRIFNGYGTTETFWNTFLRPDDLPEMAGSAGRSCVDDDVRVIKVYEDRVAEPDDLAATDGSEVGEVIIRSNAKSAAFYFGNPAETRRRFHDGFFYTNDLGTWDENHYFHIVGRKDDMIISGGENIYPVEVEEVLNLHPAVKDCIVTAAPDSRRGEIVTAYVIAADPSLTAQKLERYCKESSLLANYKRPHYYRFVSELPRNVTGKKMHYVMKQLAELDLQEGRLIRV